MEPTKQPIGANAPSPTRLSDSPRESGEVEQLAQRSQMAIANLEQEFEMLATRLQNVIRQEPIATTEKPPEPKQSSTPLGLMLTDVVVRTDSLVVHVRQLRDMLGN